MLTPTEKYLVELYRQRKAREGRQIGKILLYYKERPRVISYGDGTEISLENDTTHPTRKNFDRVTIKSPKGVFILNEMLAQPVYFQDTCYTFDAITLMEKTKQEYKVQYGSRRLMHSKRNLYQLLHEISHIRAQIEGYMADKPLLELTMWLAADVMIAQMGLNLFTNDEERQLYRDIGLRSYDMFGEEEIIKTGLMTQIDYSKFSTSVMNGLYEAAYLDISLQDLCQKLIDEKQQK